MTTREMLDRADALAQEAGFLRDAHLKNRSRGLRLFALGRVEALDRLYLACLRWRETGDQARIMEALVGADVAFAADHVQAPAGGSVGELYFQCMEPAPTSLPSSPLADLYAQFELCVLARGHEDKHRGTSGKEW